MNRETARQEIKTQISCKRFLQKSKSGLYCCPFCGSGGGSNATGALKVYDTNTWTCFSCHRSGDVIDLYRDATGTGYNEALSLMGAEIGITVDSYRPAPEAAESPQRKDSAARAGSIPVDTGAAQTAHSDPTEAPADYTEYFRECRQRLNDPAAQSYLQRRGISTATAQAYWIGFDPAADPANAPGAMGDARRPHPLPRLIIPSNGGHYVGRRIDGVKDFDKVNAKGSTPGIFNERVLFAQDVQEVFVTEGAFDALSVLEAGAAAIALNSAANADALIRKLERRRTDATLILCLDNDDNGKKATETIRAGLQRLNIGFVIADICGGCKDPNEALTADRSTFFESVERARHMTAARPDNTAYYIDQLMGGEIEKFRADRKTGFSNLDREAGGLYGGLYVLAAISSLGKTSFALQLADQLAGQGNDVVFFSMEQSRLELVSKSFARMTAQKDAEQAVTALSIRRGYRPPQVLEAARAYKEAVGDRLSIVEGNFNCNVSFIGDYVRQYMKRTGTRPVIFVDYLQILQPPDDTRRQTVREAVDTTVTELKRLSRELDLTVIVISSVNRGNYLTPIDFESLKESGGIEYTADVVWGLQLQCLNGPVFDKQNNIKERREEVKRAKAETPRKIELVCLKNRYGKSSYSCYFDYYPANDLFIESNEATLVFKSEGTARRTGATRI